MTIDPYKKICKYEFCHLEFLAKRTNQEFCCREHYIKHNNAKAKSIRDSTKKHEKILHRNREILKNFSMKKQVTKEELEKTGFRFGYFTAILKDKNGQPVYACYDFFIKGIDSNTIKIFQYE